LSCDTISAFPVGRIIVAHPAFVMRIEYNYSLRQRHSVAAASFD
jgi:hypothetical protein